MERETRQHHRFPFRTAEQHPQGSLGDRYRDGVSRLGAKAASSECSATRLAPFLSSRDRCCVFDTILSFHWPGSGCAGLRGLGFRTANMTDVVSLATKAQGIKDLVTISKEVNRPMVSFCRLLVGNSSRTRSLRPTAVTLASMTRAAEGVCSQGVVVDSV